jgi:hypothetical protein
VSPDRARVRLVLADGGEFYLQDVEVPRSSLEAYERLIDCLREDPVVLRDLYIDCERLVSAQVVDGED